MANKVWIGAAQAVAQVTRITFSAYTATVTYTLTINNKSVSYTAVASTSADVWNGLMNAWNSSQIAEHVEAIATVSSGVVLTGRTPGIPFTVTASATSGTPTITALTAATGPNFRNNGANWLPAGAPAAGDTMQFKNSGISLTYELEDVANNYSHITIEASYTGSIGLPETNASGYPEYRPRFLKLGNGSHSFNVTIGQGSGSQSPRIQIDANTATLAVAIYDSGSDAIDGRPIQIKNMDSSSTVEVYGGFVAFLADTTAAINTLAVIERQDTVNKPYVDVGAGVTVTSSRVVGGRLNNYGTITTLDALESAQVYNYGAMPTARSASRSVIFWVSPTGLTTKAVVYPLGTLDFSGHGSTKAVQAIDVHAGGNLNDSNGVCTYTTGIVLVGCKIPEVTIDVGRARTLTVT